MAERDYNQECRECAGKWRDKNMGLYSRAHEKRYNTGYNADPLLDLSLTAPIIFV